MFKKAIRALKDLLQRRRLDLGLGPALNYVITNLEKKVKAIARCQD